MLYAQMWMPGAVREAVRRTEPDLTAGATPHLMPRGENRLTHCALQDCAAHGRALRGPELPIHVAHRVAPTSASRVPTWQAGCRCQSQSLHLFLFSGFSKINWVSVLQKRRCTPETEVDNNWQPEVELLQGVEARWAEEPGI